MQDICAQLTGEDLCWIALCYANIFGVAVFNASMLDWIGFHLSSIYMHCPWSSSRCSSRQGICAKLTREGHIKCNGNQCIYAWLTRVVHLPSIYMHYPRSSSGCSSMLGICAWLTGKGHMKCNGIQGISSKLTGRSICLLYIWIIQDVAVGVAVWKASMLNWLGSICLLYIGIVLDLAVGVAVWKASMLKYLGGPSAFYIKALS